jgi:hypothetical protein
LPEKVAEPEKIAEPEVEMVVVKEAGQEVDQ